MAKRKPDEPKKGAPEWQCTFSDLMNLLLCFFVLLFSMSSVDANKWEQVVASMTSAFSVFNSGSTSIGNGTLVGIGTSQLSDLDEYYDSLGQTAEDLGEDERQRASDSEASAGSSAGRNQDTETGGKEQDTEIGGKNQNTEVGGQTSDDTDSGREQDINTGGRNQDSDAGSVSQDDNGGASSDTEIGGKTLVDKLAALGKAETEDMLDSIAELTEQYNISDSLELSMDVTGKYVEITLSGSLLFDSGSAELKSSCLPLLSKVGDILKLYSSHSIDIIGHTDNVPMHNSQFDSNDILSSARAISAAQYLVKEKGIDVTRLSWTGRGEYEPIASNSTAEGRARNRRIEIRIYNSYNSD